MRILFQGDSITDADRDRSDIHNLGNGYPLYAAEYIRERHQNEDFEFLNTGISGDQTCHILERLQQDIIDLNPDVVSIMIGINDTWHRAETREWLDNAVFEDNYRKVLSGIKEKTNAKIMILEQYLVPDFNKDFFREDLDFKIDITRKLAREFADVFVPTDALIAKALLKNPPTFFTYDGVHPNLTGSQFIGELYADAFEEILK